MSHRFPTREAILSPSLSKMTLEIGHVPCGDPGSYAYELVQKILAPVEYETFKPERLPHLPDVAAHPCTQAVSSGEENPLGWLCGKATCPRGTVCARP